MALEAHVRENRCWPFLRHRSHQRSGLAFRVSERSIRKPAAISSVTEASYPDSKSDKHVCFPAPTLMVWWACSYNDGGGGGTQERDFKHDMELFE